MPKIVLFALLLVCTLAQAQTQHSTFQSITIEDGLSHSTVYSITQDAKGFLWFATADGLSRYDGYSFKVYRNNSGNSNSLSGSELMQVMEDSKGYVWVVTRDTESNLNRLDPYTGQVLRVKHSPKNARSLSSNAVYDVFEDSHGNIWVNADGTINLLDSASASTDSLQFTQSYLPDGKGKQWKMFEDTKGNLLIFSDNLYALDRQNLLATPLFYLQAQPVVNISETPAGNIWIGTQYLGVKKLRYQASNNTYHIEYNLKSNITPANRTCVAADNWNRVWIGTEEHGLVMYDDLGGAQTVFMNDELDLTSLSDNTINSLFIDRSGVLWVGTMSKGLCKYNLYRKQFHHIKQTPNSGNSLSGKVISSIHSNTPNELWVGADLGGGVNRVSFTPGQVPQFINHKNDPNDPNTLGGNNVLSLWQQRNGTVWVGSAFGKTSKIIPGKFGDGQTQILDYSHLKGWHFSFFEDSNDTIWTGTYGGGIMRINARNDGNATFTHQANDPNSLSGNIVWAIYEDRQGNIWIGTRGEGISMLKTDQRYLPKPSFFNVMAKPDMADKLTNATVSVFHQDGDGALWLGTAGGLVVATCPNNDFGALTKPDDITFRTFRTEQGLASDLIQGIEEDGHNNLWISTSRGLSRFNKSTQQFTNYTKSDGLQSNEFWHNSYFKDPNGWMFFGGANGLNFFHPDSIHPNPFLPMVQLVDLKLFNKTVEANSLVNNQNVLAKPIEFTDHIELSHKNNVLTLEFAALHYTDPKSNLYAYQMKGFDKEWIHTTATRRYATYTNLPPGSYRFMVKASNNDQIWNNDLVRELRVTILPPWWKTLWFRLTLLLVIIGGALAFYWVRVNALKRQQARLQYMVEVRTEELRGANSELQERQEEILQQNEEITQQNHEITRQKEFVDKKNNEIERAYANMQRLSEFGQQLTATLKVSEIGNMIYRHVAAMVDVDILGLGIYLPRRKAINFAFFIERGNAHPSFMSQLDDPTSLAAWTVKNQQVVFSNDFEQEYSQYISQIKVVSDKVPCSVISVPLTMENRPIGVLSLQSYHKDAFTEKDFTNIRSLASYMAIALDNAEAYQTIEKQNGHIKDSISYAQTIQNAMLPTAEFLAQRSDCFVLFSPKDIVSGDFYWSVSIPNTEEHRELFVDHPNCSELFFVAVVDCTGHGVPGAFMSMIGSRLLSEIVLDQHVMEPCEILAELDRNIVKSLKQEQGGNNDGMDLCLLKVFIDPKAPQLQAVFAGAKSPLYHYVHATKQMAKLTASRKSIGGKKYELENVDYTQDNLVIERGDVVYLASDGYADQNCKDRKRLSSRQLVSILTSNAEAPMPQQYQILKTEFNTFKGDELQRDDVTVIGLRF